MWEAMVLWAFEMTCHVLQNTYSNNSISFQYSASAFSLDLKSQTYNHGRLSFDTEVFCWGCQNITKMDFDFGAVDTCLAKAVLRL